jgi:hypothetical protein
MTLYRLVDNVWIIENKCGYPKLIKIITYFNINLKIHINKIKHVLIA